MKVTAIIRKDQPDKDGLCKILLRINRGDKRQYLTTEHKVKLSQFKKGKVVGHPEANRINSALQKEIILWEEGEKKASKVTFESYASAFISHAEKTQNRTRGTIRYYRSALNKFLTFAPDLPLSSITADLLKAYHVYMKSLGNDNNTMWSSFKFLKMIFNAAISDEIISKTPFSNYKGVSYKKPPRRFLTPKEIGQIVRAEINPGSPLYNVSRWFLLQCYTGVRAGDLNKLKKDTIINEGRINIITGKSGTITTLPLSDEILQLLNEVPLFNISLEEYNRQLKALGALAGIEKEITSHMGRHSFGMRSAQTRVSIEATSKAMGHKKISTTQIYYDVQNPRVDDEYRGFKY